MEENKLKKAKQNNKTLKLLGKISTIVIILLLSLISFVGIYVKDKNTMKNVIPEYKLGTDLYGARNILIKVDDSTTTKKYDSDGNLVKDSSDGDEKNENITEVEEKVNPDELRTADNYEAVKNIIEARLKYMKVEDYLLRFDESTGDISLEVSENSNTDYIAQYTITKGEFKIVDNIRNYISFNDVQVCKLVISSTSSTQAVKDEILDILMDLENESDEINPMIVEINEDDHVELNNGKSGIVEDIKNNVYTIEVDVKFKTGNIDDDIMIVAANSIIGRK